MSTAAARGSETRPLRVGAALAGVVLAAVLLFSLGVMTGSRVARRAPETAAAPMPAASPVPAAPAAAPAAAPVSAGSLTFYDRLSGAAVPPPAIPADDTASRATAEAGATTERPGPPSAAVAAAERPGTQPRGPAPPAARAGGAAPPAPVSGTAARVNQLMSKGPYSVQVAAVTERATAATAADVLRRQGLPATMSTAAVKGKTWYRLRMGPFASREAAARAAGLLRAELGLDATPVRE